VALAQLVVDRSRELLDVENAGLYEVVEGMLSLEILASSSATGATEIHPRHSRSGVLSQVARDARPLIVNDYRRWEGASSRAIELGLRSVAAVPLVVADRVIGVLAVNSSRPRHFGRRHVEALSLLVAQVGPALEAARLHAERVSQQFELEERYLQLRALQEVSREVLESLHSEGLAERILHRTLALARCDLGAIMLYDPVADRHEVLARAGFRHPDFHPRVPDVTRGRHLLLSRKTPRVIQDLSTIEGFRAIRREHIVSMLVLPLLVDDQALGVLLLGVRSPRTFAPPEVELLQALANQLAMALQKTRLHAEMQQAYADLQQSEDQHRRLEEQLVRAQRLEAAGRVAGQVAHDFNNLLAPLAGYPELIQRRYPQDRTVQTYCSAMLEAARVMAEINDELLTLGRRGHFDFEVVDLHALIHTALGEFSPPPSLKLRLELCPESVMVSGSPAQLLRVLHNLIANAREAMADQGTLILHTARHALTENGSGRAGPFLSLSVSDTGEGVPEAIRDQIFEAFFTTKQGRRRGAGLGLSVVQAVVEDHDGWIELESEVRIGSTFRVWLPLTSAAFAPVAGPSVQEGSGESILVVDDELQRVVMTDLLHSLGYYPCAVASGEEALAVFAQGPVDLVILDMRMTGIDGTETYRRMRELRPDQRAIVLSGYAETGRVQQALNLGVSAYVRKPVNLEELARAVRTALDRALRP
jgi:signal transduction histidine kinase